jgi:Ser/Thr protein kinase RdoA (MazF antagonist)
MRPEIIVQHFPLPIVRTVTPVGRGLLHATYRVGTVGGDFVVQRLHAAIPDSAIDDMRMVTAYLVACGLQVPALIPTLDGKPFARDKNGGRWRVYPWLPGHVLESLPDPAMAHAAGRLVGLLHKYLAACDYIPQGSILHFHDTAFVLAELQHVHPQLPDEVRGIADDIIAILPSLIVADEPQQLIHGDLKISNLIFDDLGHAVGIIDFDTILRHARAIDLGDAFRSWCNRTAEDDPEATFDVDFFEAAASGYAQGVGLPSSPETRARHLRATRHITLELAARFLIDVVRDAYFGFDASRYPHRRAHNVARARGQYHLAQTIPCS